MYSPKVKPDLVRKLYHLRQAMGKPMTKVVDELLRPKVDGLYRQIYGNQRIVVREAERQLYLAFDEEGESDPF
jgi:hypothetical protein